MKTQLQLLVALIAGMGVVGRIPPLSVLDSTYQDWEGPLDPASYDYKDAPMDHASLDYLVNPGLEGGITMEDWDQYTVKGENPSLVHPGLNGAATPTTVTGTKMTTIKGREINAFMGIKYGAPPVGPRRFKKTEPAGVYWTGDLLDATHLGEKCPQRAMLGDIGSGDEDCLHLNVFTPYMPEEGKGALPVMLFIHGGAFISGDSSLYLPTKLLDKDVILVVIHYRLGTFGFFCLQNDDAPGNVALWDQIESMKWVRDNIGGFGGDKDRVTIFGESAGSASVNYHLILPASRGLFHGVIGQSGSALDHWSHDPDPIVSAELIGAANGCPTHDHTLLYDCMMTLPADNISLTIHHFVDADRQQGEMGFRGAAPVTQVEGLAGSLITKMPEQYFLDGDVADVPLMIGANKHEGSFVFGIMYLAYLIPNGYLNDDYYKRNEMLTDLLNAFGVNDATHGIIEALKDAFVGDVDLADFEAASPGLIDMASVFFIKAGAWRTAKLHALYTKADTFFYSLDFESDDTMFRWLFAGHSEDEFPFRAGVTHADDLMYLFSLPAHLDGHQLVVKDRMVTLWTNFATYGNPTPPEDDSWETLDIPKWESLTNASRHYMLFQDEFTLEQEYSERWHIAFSEDGPAPQGPTQAEYDALAKESQAYMISMIVFAVASLGLAGLAASFYQKRTSA